MDSEKLKQLEARLKEMLEMTAEPKGPVIEEIPKRAEKKVVIRRRKGEQDKRISLG